MDNNHEVEDLTPARRVPWNKGNLIGAKPPRCGRATSGPSG